MLLTTCISGLGFRVHHDHDATTMFTMMAMTAMRMFVMSPLNKLLWLRAQGVANASMSLPESRQHAAPEPYNN